MCGCSLSLGSPRSTPSLLLGLLRAILEQEGPWQVREQLPEPRTHGHCPCLCPGSLSPSPWATPLQDVATPAATAAPLPSGDQKPHGDAMGCHTARRGAMAHDGTRWHNVTRRAVMSHHALPAVARPRCHPEGGKVPSPALPRAQDRGPPPRSRLAPAAWEARPKPVLLLALVRINRRAALFIINHS